jgi:hypothetical protein
VSLRQKSKQHIQALQKYKIPAAPGHIIMKSEDPSKVVDAEAHFFTEVV